MQQLKVTICGRVFSIATDEQTDTILQAAKLVETRLNELARNSGSSVDDQIRIAIFLALHVTSENLLKNLVLAEHDNKIKELIKVLDSTLV